MNTCSDHEPFDFIICIDEKDPRKLLNIVFENGICHIITDNNLYYSGKVTLENIPKLVDMFKHQQYTVYQDELQFKMHICDVNGDDIVSLKMILVPYDCFISQYLQKHINIALNHRYDEENVIGILK